MIGRGRGLGGGSCGLCGCCCELVAAVWIARPWALLYGGLDAVEVQVAMDLRRRTCRVLVCDYRITRERVCTHDEEPFQTKVGGGGKGQGEGESGWAWSFGPEEEGDE
jgi:hypothetical protein